MKVREITTKIYGCEVCGEEYKDDEKAARKCEKLPVEEQVFREGDKVEINYPGDSGRGGEIYSIKLCSPINNDDMISRIGISRKFHFFLYTIRVLGKGFITLPAKYLNKT